MDSVILPVSGLGDEDRRVFERALGQPLRNDEQVVVHVQHPPGNTANGESPTEELHVPEWWKVYDGLSDSEMDELDAIIRQRADLSREVILPARKSGTVGRPCHNIT